MTPSAATELALAGRHYDLTREVATDVVKVRIEVCDPEAGWGGQIRIDSSGLVILTREWEYGAYSIQHTRL